MSDSASAARQASLWYRRKQTQLPAAVKACSVTSCNCEASQKSLVELGMGLLDPCFFCDHGVSLHAVSNGSTSARKLDPMSLTGKTVLRDVVEIRDDALSMVELQNARSLPLSDVKNAHAGAIDAKHNDIQRGQEEADVRLAKEISLAEVALPKQSEGYILCLYCQNYFKPEAAVNDNRPGCPRSDCQIAVAGQRRHSSSKK